MVVTSLPVSSRTDHDAQQTLLLCRWFFSAVPLGVLKSTLDQIFHFAHASVYTERQISSSYCEDGRFATPFGSFLFLLPSTWHDKMSAL